MSHLHYCPKLIEIFVRNCETIMQKNHKIAIVKFCFKIVKNRNQSCVNFQFSKFKVHGLDIKTLIGAKGPPQGPQGPREPEGPSALRRS